MADFGITLRQAFTRDPLHAIEYLPPETLRTGTLNELTDLYGLGRGTTLRTDSKVPPPRPPRRTTRRTSTENPGRTGTGDQPSGRPGRTVHIGGQAAGVRPRTAAPRTQRQVADQLTACCRPHQNPTPQKTGTTSTTRQSPPTRPQATAPPRLRTTSTTPPNRRGQRGAHQHAAPTPQHHGPARTATPPALSAPLPQPRPQHTGDPTPAAAPSAAPAMRPRPFRRRQPAGAPSSARRHLRPIPPPTCRRAWATPPCSAAGASGRLRQRVHPHSRHGAPRPAGSLTATPPITGGCARHQHRDAVAGPPAGPSPPAASFRRLRNCGAQPTRLRLNHRRLRFGGVAEPGGAVRRPVAPATPRRTAQRWASQRQTRLRPRRRARTRRPVPGSAASPSPGRPQDVPPTADHVPRRPADRAAGLRAPRRDRCSVCLGWAGAGGGSSVASRHPDARLRARAGPDTLSPRPSPRRGRPGSCSAAAACEFDFEDDFGDVRRARQGACRAARPAWAGAPAHPLRPARRRGSPAGAARACAVAASAWRSRRDVQHAPSPRGTGCRSGRRGDGRACRAADLTDKVQLTWTATRDLDFAVVVAAEGQENQVLLAERNHSMTVAVEPGRKYCFLVQATDGDDVYESNSAPSAGGHLPEVASAARVHHVGARRDGRVVRVVQPAVRQRDLARRALAAAGAFARLRERGVGVQFAQVVVQLRTGWTPSRTCGAAPRRPGSP